MLPIVGRNRFSKHEDWKGAAPPDTCLGRPLGTVISNTKIAFFSDLAPPHIGHWTYPRLLHHQDAVRLLVKIVEEFITAGRQRPHIDNACAAGRDHLLNS
jgi:hypothetical protein